MSYAGAEKDLKKAEHFFNINIPVSFFRQFSSVENLQERPNVLYPSLPQLKIIFSMRYMVWISFHTNMNVLLLSVQCHTRGEFNWLYGLDVCWRRSDKLWHVHHVADPLHSLFLRVLVQTRLQGLQVSLISATVKHLFFFSSYTISLTLWVDFKSSHGK